MCIKELVKVKNLIYILNMEFCKIRIMKLLHCRIFPRGIGQYMNLSLRNTQINKKGNVFEMYKFRSDSHKLYKHRKIEQGTFLKDIPTNIVFMHSFCNTP